MSSSYIDVDFFESDWSHLNMSDPMMSFINPSLICPNEYTIETSPQVFGNVTNIVNQQQVQLDQSKQSMSQQLALHHQQQQQIYRAAAANFTNENSLYQPCSSSTTTYYQENPDQFVQQPQYQIQSLIDAPPVLTKHEEPKFSIHDKLQMHRELGKKRRESLKAKLEKQPASIAAHLIRKSSGKKMTGRERQLELEKQEANELKLRDHYVGLINQLEAKCNKLREILENIVTTSPDYENQMMIYLETEKLLDYKPDFPQENNSPVHPQ